MSERRAFLDIGPGEARGVVTLDGRPERLILAREAEAACQALGAVSVGRVRKVERGLAIAFVALPEGPDGIANLGPDTAGLAEGQAVTAEVRSEARGGKGPALRLTGAAEGAPRLVRPAPSLAETLKALAKGREPARGAAARRAADEAEAEALETVFPLPGGGTIAVETTRALVAIDVDVGERAGGGGGRGGFAPKRVTRSANLAALAEAARILRLKGEGGLVAIDLAGRGHDGAALLAAARAAFAPDNPGVALGPVSRFGVLELTLPRRRRSAAERLLGADGRPTLETLALRLARALDSAAEAEPAARLEARAAPDVAAAAGAYLKGLEARFGARLAILAEPGRAAEAFEVRSP